MSWPMITELNGHQVQTKEILLFHTPLLLCVDHLWTWGMSHSQAHNASLSTIVKWRNFTGVSSESSFYWAGGWHRSPRFTEIWILLHWASSWVCFSSPFFSHSWPCLWALIMHGRQPRRIIMIHLCHLRVSLCIKFNGSPPKIVMITGMNTIPTRRSPIGCFCSYSLVAA